MAQFFAYVHARPETINPSGIFYVGKGNITRVKKIERRNRHHSNIVSKYGAENILVGKLECSSEEIAFELEKGLIKCLQRAGINLTNRTEGGDGVSGLKFSSSSKEKMSLSAQLRFQNPEEQQKQSAAQKKRFQNPEERLKHKLATCSPEARERQAAGTRGKKRTVESKEKMAIAAIARSTPEANLKHSNKMKEAWTDPEKRKRMADSQKLRREKEWQIMLSNLKDNPWRKE
jgi:hypothetical protein